MTRSQAIEWALKNLPEWPKSSQNHINIPSRVWAFIGNKNTAIINVQTGELITRDEFYTARKAKRLQPCGMSYKELIEDLFL